MKKIIALAAIAAACSTSAFAQVSNFTGTSVGLNLDHTAVTTNLPDLGGASIDGIGQQSVGASVQAAYGVALSNNSVLSVGANYSLTDAKAGQTKNEDTTITFKAKNQYSLYLEPGMLVSDKTLAYGKVTYNSAKVTAEMTGGGGASETVTGIGYGFGIRTMLDKNLSLQAEVKSVKYDAKGFGDSSGEFKTSTTVGTIGLSYKF